VAYAEFNSGLRFVRAEEVEANGLDMAALRHLATKNPTNRTRELRIMGGGSDVVVICAEGNFEPSLILLDEVWRDPRARVDGNRLVTIAERGFAITAGCRESAAHLATSTRIIVRAHEETDPAILALLGSVGDWVTSRNASLVVEGLDAIH
jgi:hypothetical protein